MMKIGAFWLFYRFEIHQPWYQVINVLKIWIFAVLHVSDH